MAPEEQMPAIGRPPRHPFESPLPDRTAEHDTEGLRLAELALAALAKLRGGVLEAPGSQEMGSGTGSEPTPRLRVPAPCDAAPKVHKDYEGTGEWPKTKGLGQPGAKQKSWGNIGFPHDQSLELEDFEEDTRIDRSEPHIGQLAKAISLIQTRPAGDIVGVGDVVRRAERGPYDGTSMSKRWSAMQLENGRRWTLSNEWLAEVLLCRAGRIGGRTQNYWRRARDVARQQLHANPNLEVEVRRQMSEGRSDPSFEKMLRFVKIALKRKAFNPYHHARRDEYATAHAYSIKSKNTDIFMALDKSNKVIAFQCADAFRRVLTKRVEKKVARSLETFSTRQAVPLPDMTRHGLHWIDWLAERPDLDARNPKNDRRLAKMSRDCVLRPDEFTSGPLARQFLRIRYSAFGADTEVIGSFFRILYPELLEQHVQVAREVDSSDWQYGLVGIAPVGDYQSGGGDLVLRELRPSVVVVNTTHEAIRRWALRRQDNGGGEEHSAPRFAAGESESESTVDSCCANCPCGLEDALPENQRILEEYEWMPERHMGEFEFQSEDSEEEEDGTISEASEASLPGANNLRRPVTMSAYASAGSWRWCFFG
ncbi:hypothetical protein F4778DRAFT_776908 [Xylariomycetidae sp. FL2044]|nr:hypothetical protein F4778DRAFT_776908 [Xylariomycetidae sp. FL2044]